jgi:transcriptional regulator with XRE-family HTH domain
MSGKKPREELRGFADALRAARKAAGISRFKLSGMLGVHQDTVADWEKAKYPPAERNLRKLMEVLGDALEVSVVSVKGMPLEGGSSHEFKNA